MNIRMKRGMALALMASLLLAGSAQAICRTARKKQAVFRVCWGKSKRLLY